MLVLIALYILSPSHRKVCTVKVLIELDMTEGHINSMVVLANKTIIVFSLY